MKVKISVINTAAGALSHIKLFRIKDKSVAQALIRSFYNLRRIALDAGARQEAVTSKFHEDWADDFREVSSMARAGQPIVGHEEYLEKAVEVEAMVRSIFAEEVEVDVYPVELDAFVDAVYGDEGPDLDAVAILIDAGVIITQN